MPERIPLPPTSLRIAAVVAVACVLAPVGDWSHVTSGTTAYDWDPGPHLLRSPWWFVVAIAGVTAAACVLFERLAPPAAGADSGVVRAAGALGGVMAIYSASALLRDAPLTTTTVALVAAALCVWACADGSRRGFLVGAFVAVAGPTGEALLCALGAFRYAPEIDGLAGVAPWLPALHFSFGVAIAGVSQALAELGRRSPVGAAA